MQNVDTLPETGFIGVIHLWCIIGVCVGNSMDSKLKTVNTICHCPLEDYLETCQMYFTANGWEMFDICIYPHIFHKTSVAVGREGA